MKLIRKDIQALKAQEPIPDQPDKTFDAKEAAKYLGISYWTLTVMAKAGQIPHSRVGVKQGKLLFRKNSLDLWKKNSEITPSKQDDKSVGYGTLRKVKA